jgi:hypothetical protein
MFAEVIWHSMLFFTSSSAIASFAAVFWHFDQFWFGAVFLMILSLILIEGILLYLHCLRPLALPQNLRRLLIQGPPLLPTRVQFSSMMACKPIAERIAEMASAQCKEVGMELYKLGQLSEDDIDSLLWIVTNGIPAVVLFRFLLRSSESGIKGWVLDGVREEDIDFDKINFGIFGSTAGRTLQKLRGTVQALNLRENCIECLAIEKWLLGLEKEGEQPLRWASCIERLFGVGMKGGQGEKVHGWAMMPFMRNRRVRDFIGQLKTISIELSQNQIYRSLLPDWIRRLKGEINGLGHSRDVELIITISWVADEIEIHCRDLASAVSADADEAYVPIFYLSSDETVYQLRRSLREKMSQREDVAGENIMSVRFLRHPDGGMFEDNEKISSLLPRRQSGRASEENLTAPLVSGAKRKIKCQMSLEVKIVSKRALSLSNAEIDPELGLIESEASLRDLMSCASRSRYFGRVFQRLENMADDELQSIRGESWHRELQPALQNAFRCGEVKVAYKLRLAGADVDNEFACLEDASYCLRMSASRGSSRDIVHALERRADVDSCDEDGTTALMLALSQGHLQVVRQLLEHGADRNRSNKNGLCVVASLFDDNPKAWFFLAAQFEDCKEVRKSLDKSQVDVNERSPAGSTALMSASRAGHCEVVSLLLQKRAEVHTKNQKGASALSIAEQFQVDCVIPLLRGN